AGSARPDEPLLTCDFSEPTGMLMQLAENYIQCVINNGINTEQLLRPYPLPEPFECGIYALQLSLWDLNPESQQCDACLINVMQYLAYDEVTPYLTLQTCSGAGPNVKPPFEGIVLGGPRFTLNGENGILILSKFPISDVSET